MRITPGQVAARITADLQRSLAALTQKEGLLASGKRLSAPSDDPGASAQAIVMRSRQAAIDQYGRNIGAARDQLDAVDATLRTVTTTLTRAHEIAIQGSNDSNDAIARQSLGSEVNQLLEQLVSLATSRGPRGAMLFGGQETTTAPYTVTRDVNGAITAVTPNPRGLDATTSVEVSEGVTVTTSVSGTSVFGASTDPTYAFAQLIALRDALNTNDAVTVRGSLDSLAATLDRATLASTAAGSQLGWLDSLEQRAKDQAVGVAGSLSRLEDTDIISAAEHLQELQTAYQAALAASSQLMQMSLVNFLR